MGMNAGFFFAIVVPLLLFVFVVIAILVTAFRYFVKRPSSLPIVTAASVSSETPTLTPGKPRTTALKIISFVYLVGGAFGAINALSQLNGVILGLLTTFEWLIMLAQVSAALYGGWQFWNGKHIGAQILYWLSWSCVPVLSFPLLTYWCAMGFSFTPAITIGYGNFGIDFGFHFIYDAEVSFFPNVSNLHVGINLVAVVFVSMLKKIMKESDIPYWPLAFPQKQVDA
jgi:hypothetical protein